MVGYYFSNGERAIRHETHFQDYLEKLERESREKAEKSDPYVKLARASVEAWVRGRERIAVPEGLRAHGVETLIEALNALGLTAR